MSLGSIDVALAEPPFWCCVTSAETGATVLPVSTVLPGSAHFGSCGKRFGCLYSSRSTQTPGTLYVYRPSPNALQARLKDCASALVMAQSLSAHSSPVPE